jgi:hypothetical protein
MSALAALMPASMPAEWVIANHLLAVRFAQDVYQDLKAKAGKVSQHLHIGGVFVALGGIVKK